jgi:hypothetical protein
MFYNFTAKFNTITPINNLLTALPVISLHYEQTSDKHQKKCRSPRLFEVNVKNPLSLEPSGFSLVAEAGFEPTTFGL